jgi:penicillin-binding protein 1C
MDPADMQTQSWFVLSPVEQWYYRKRHSDYIPLPPFMPGCTLNDAAAQSMTLIYPSRDEKIYIPREREGQRGKTIFEVAHRDAGAVIYWHMDGRYLGSTRGVHKMEIDAPFGLHHFTLVDGKGDMLRFKVTFLQKESRRDSGG